MHVLHLIFKSVWNIFNMFVSFNGTCYTILLHLCHTLKTLKKNRHLHLKIYYLIKLMKISLEIKHVKKTAIISHSHKDIKSHVTNFHHNHGNFRL